MSNCQIALRTTPERGVFDLEVVVRPPLLQGDSFEALLPQHRVRCLYRYIVHTSVRTILRAKLARTSTCSDTDTKSVMGLLEGLRRHFVAAQHANSELTKLSA
jgi:hypothetical protein